MGRQKNIAALTAEAVAQWMLNGAVATGMLLGSMGAAAGAVAAAVATGIGISLLGGGLSAAAGVVGMGAVSAFGTAEIGLGIPAMATGGVVTSPTMALVGEGRYSEAVVPLGDSPQFASMKTDIANAVLQGLTAVQSGGGGCGEIILDLDGEVLARAVLPKIEKENRRRGCKIQYSGV